MLHKFWQKLPGSNTKRADYWIFGVIALFAVLGLISAFVLSVEKIHLIRDSNAVLSCTISIWLNCASVMETWQAEVFGFPNSFIGLMAYPVMITLAVGKLMGATYSRLFMFLAQIGTILGLVFAYWLFFQSVYVIQVLCPWCLVVTFSTTLIFEALLRYNIRENNLYLPKSIHRKLLVFLQRDYDKLLVAIWLVLMVALVYTQFKDYFAL